MMCITNVRSLSHWSGEKSSNKNFMLVTTLSQSYSHAYSPPLSDAFSHHVHTQPPPQPSSPPQLPVDAPNKATCVVSGCLGERSPCQPAGRVYQGTVSTPARCSALFSFSLLLLLTPQICHPCHPSRSPLGALLLIPINSLLFLVSPLSHSCILYVSFIQFLLYLPLHLSHFTFYVSVYPSFQCQLPCKPPEKQT